MEDIYVVRNEKSIIALKGHREGAPRRQIGSGAKVRTYGGKVLENRRKSSDRRYVHTLSFKDRCFERISCLVNGIALLVVGLFFVLTGVTFLPILGLFIGGYIIIQAFVVMAEVVHKVE